MQETEFRSQETGGREKSSGLRGLNVQYPTPNDQCPSQEVDVSVWCSGRIGIGTGIGIAVLVVIHIVPGVRCQVSRGRCHVPEQKTTTN